MEPAVTIAIYLLLFGGTHIGLASAPVRSRLVERFGEVGFGILFSVVAAVAFTLLVNTYARLRFDGVPGIALATVPVARELLLVLSGLSVLLMLGSLARYAASPYAIYSAGHDGEPRGLERVSRHSFFAAVILFGAAHMLLATHLVGTVAFGGLALFAGLGAWHQDRKLLALRGAPYARFLAVTSTLPFAAILAGRQQLVPSELPWGHFATGIIAAVYLRWVHPAILSSGGAWVIGVVVGGAALLTVEALVRARRVTRRRSLDAHPRSA
ncbi:MAG TPA: NnrU family protein [Candidatus Eisenbacteria bacterium]|nr:NnrU family protein [Candidatus Eisenbacteria bacterium]